MSRVRIGSPVEWLWPLAFCLCFGWVVWHGPAYILDFGPENQQLVAQYERSDITPAMPPLFGTAGDIVDYLALAWKDIAKGRGRGAIAWLDQADVVRVAPLGCK